MKGLRVQTTRGLFVFLSTEYRRSFDKPGRTARQKRIPMNQIENGSRIDRLVRERWNVEETLTTLKAAVRRLLRDRAGFERMRETGHQLRAAVQIKNELEKQLAESYRTVRFVYPL